MDKPPDRGQDWARRFFAVTLFVDDLARERAWYEAVFSMPIADESDDSCTFVFPGDIYVNLNSMAGAQHHIAPAPFAPVGTPSRMMLSLRVDDVDAVVAHLSAMGVNPVNGPVDQPWGSRAATIADPSGNYWELFSR